MSKVQGLRNLMQVISDSKQDMKNSPGRIDYNKLPDSITNHRANKQPSRTTNNASRAGSTDSWNQRK